MSRVTSLKRKAIQHKLDREIHKAKVALKRYRNPRPVKKVREDADGS